MTQNEHSVRRDVVETTVSGGDQRVIREKIVETPQHTAVSSVEQRTTYVPSEADQRLASLRRIRQIVYFIASAIAVLILLRFGLLLLGANPDNAFANFVYSLSGVFVAPFNTLFGEPQFGNSVLEISSLIAIAVYYLIAWGIVKVITLSTAPQDPSGRAYE
jgi:hypothetical protein